MGRPIRHARIQSSCYTPIRFVSDLLTLRPRALCLQIRYKPHGCVIINLYYGAWADQRLATVLQISCCPVYKWFVTQL